jgi:signal transduction histidine kinase
LGENERVIQAWAAHARRRALEIPGWPYVAGGVLSAFAVLEVLVSNSESGTRLLTSLLLALGTTAPVGLLAAHWLAPVSLVSAVLISLVVEPRLTVAGFVALLATFYHMGRHRAGWLVAVMLAPLVVLTIGELVSDSGPAEDVQQVVSGPAPSFDEPQRDRPQSADSPEPDLYPLLVTSASVATAGLGRFRRARTAEAEFQAKAATFADELEALTARGERARIARELHDVVAHRISSIAVQAETARLTTPDLPTEGARQLVAIGDSARDALAEMRRLLGILRTPADDTTDRQPQPGIGQLQQLIAEARDLSGATIRLIVSGRMAPLDPGVELTAYRIVQESLTNSRRHAPGAPVDIELEYGDDTLRVQIRDAGPGSDDTSGGLGLLGMRERVAAMGGQLTVESGPSGGFIVAATLPHVAVERAPTAPEIADG